MILGTSGRPDAERSFPSIYELLEVPLMVLSQQGNFTKANKAFCEIVGYSKKELEGLSIEDLIVETDRIHCRQALALLKAGKQDKCRIPINFIHGAGTRIYADILLAVVPGGDTTEPNVYATIKETGTIYHLEEALLEVQEKLRSILEYCPIGIGFSSGQGQYSYNGQFYELLGSAPAQRHPKPPEEWIDQRDRGAFTTQVSQLKEAKIKNFTMKARLMRTEGASVWCQLTGFRGFSLSDTNPLLVFFFQDISNQKKTEGETGDPVGRNVLANFSRSEREKLKDEVEALNRELSSNLMFISEQNSLLDSINQSLSEISSKASYEVRKELEKISSKVKHNIQLDDSWKKFKLHFDQIHPDFFTLLQNLEVGFTQKELKHCAYLKIGLSNKETAKLLDVSPKSIEMARYRIKKKLKLPKEENLSRFIQSL